MNDIFSGLTGFLPLAIWIAAGGLGGVWMARAFFRLQPNEELFVGVPIGLISVTWLVNLLGRVLPMLTACFTAAIVVLIIGFLLNFPKSRKDIGNLFSFRVNIWIWLVVFVLFLIFSSIGVGMGLYDEYPVLPLVSQIAAGDLPPHFALDPNIIYNYHYFPYLFSAQLMRIGDLLPWTALDFQRAFFLTFSLILMGLWVFRITRNKMAGIAAGVFAFFAGGTRWLMLLLPSSVLNIIGNNISRLDSGLNSGSSLRSALTSPWAAQGTGPYTIPFAFVNGFNSTTAIGLGTTNYPVLFLAIFLHTFNRWKDWKATILYTILLAALAMAHEITFVMIALGLVIVTIVYLVKNRTIRIPRQLIYLFIAVFISGIIVLFQGGVITGMFQEMITKSQAAQFSDESYQNVAFSLSFPPKVVDAHLGILSLVNPIQLFVLILEIGPMLLLLVPALIWGIRAVKANRWFEAILAAMLLISLGLSFFELSLKAGSIGSITRAQNYFTVVLRFFAIPLLFIWLAKKKESVKIIAMVLVTGTLFGGIVIFGLEMISMQKPMLSMGYEDLDAKILREYWNKLDKNYMVFDPEPIRSAVLFGRPTDAAIEWFKYKTEFLARVNNPKLVDLQKAGYGYVYTDVAYLKSLPAIAGKRFQDSCIKTLADYKDGSGGERILMDIRSCQ
jgi:hypothetical protein